MAKILVVEDNALNIKLFCDLLTAHGHDTQLPYVSGIELMELLRADEALCAVPIMAVTAYAAQGDDERIRAAGASAYVSKPISVARFAETVEQLLEEARTKEVKEEKVDPGSSPG